MTFANRALANSKPKVTINNLQMISSFWSILLLFLAFCNGLATGRIGVTTRIVGGTEVEPGKYPYFGKGHAEMEGQKMMHRRSSSYIVSTLWLSFLGAKMWRNSYSRRYCSQCGTRKYGSPSISCQSMTYPKQPGCFQ
jgi:hypothetical protein